MGLGKVQEVKICLDRGLDGNVPVYCSGEFVTGKVILVLSGEIKVKYLEIRAKGKAKVRWTETTHTGKRTHTTTYSDEVEFFNIKCILLGQERESDRAVDGPLILSPGQHEYAFSIQIPQSVLVPTFEGEYGSVRYDVKAELHRPWHLASTSSSDFTIFQHFAVNTPELMAPQIGTRDKTICCCCCASGPISLNVRIEKTGFVCGESVKIIADVENHSSRTVVPRASLIQTQLYYARGKSKSVNQTVIEVEGEKINGGAIVTWNGSLLIPPLSPSILKCNILMVTYTLKVYLDISGSLNSSIDFPFVIGTIPLAPIQPPSFPVQPIGFVFN